MTENLTIKFMIELYCKKKHKTNELCNECKELLAYCVERNVKCPRRAVKTFCASCPIHCYKKDKREQIREVMKFSGPRMIFYKPKYAISHIKDTIKNKRAGK